MSPIHGLLMLGALAQCALAAPMRSRSESVPNVQSSNTVGLGDIWVSGGMSSQFRIRPVHADVITATVDTAYRDDFRALYGSGNRLQRDLRVVPELGGTIGLANFLHLEMQSVPWDGEKLGASTARLKLTTPGNDNLRVVGVAAAVNATLSTEEDIYSRGETTPGFDPLLYFTLIADVDFIKVANDYPIKAYFNYTNLDDYTLARAYTQHQFVVAAEYKGLRKGGFVRLAALLYKPLATKFNPTPAPGYLPTHFELGLGYRTTFGDRFTLAMSLSLDPVHPLSFYDREVYKAPRAQAQVSAPLFYSETRAEAIRALIFNEQERKKLRKLAASQPQKAGQAGRGRQGPGFKADSSSHPLRLDELSLEGRKAAKSQDLFNGVFEDQDAELSAKRKQIRSQLKQIEELLE